MAKKKKAPHQIRKGTLERRNRDIQERFSHLYNQERIRLDDVVLKLAEEFYLSVHTINKILGL